MMEHQQILSQKFKIDNNVVNNNNTLEIEHNVYLNEQINLYLIFDECQTQKIWQIFGNV